MKEIKQLTLEIKKMKLYACDTYTSKINDSLLVVDGHNFNELRR